MTGGELDKIEYTVIRSSRRTLSMEVKDEGLIVRVPRFTSNARIERFVNANRTWIEKRLRKLKQRKEELAEAGYLTEDEINALTEKAKKVIPERVSFYAPLIGVTYGRITIRCQKTRWGSCSKAGNLNFNCLLMLTPPEVIDSVVVHELCHRKEMNHSQRFYAEVLKVFPGYRQADRWLKDHGRLLMDRAARS